MAEENTLPPFNQAWLESQKQYWEAWGKLTRETLGHGAQIPDLSQGLDLWWKTVGQLAPEPGREVFQRFVDQGKQFLQFNEQFLKSFQDLGKVPATPEAWRTFWEQSLHNLQAGMNQLASGNTGMFNLWNPVMEQWRKAAGKLTAMPTHNWLNMPLDGYPQMGIPGMDEYQRNLGKLLAMPGVGYTREWQEQSQALARLWMEHQKAYQDYNEVFSRVGVNTMKRFQDKLMSLSGGENPVSTLRELYDLWVDCAEDAYAEMVNTEEYAEANARLVNTLMAWKQEGRSMVDEVLGMMNLPTRRELDSVHKRIKEMRKHQRAAGDAALHAEVAALRAELAALKGETGDAAARKPSPRKTAAAKGE